MTGGFVLQRIVTWRNGDQFYFASIDGGENWLEIDQEPTQKDYFRIVSLLAGSINTETGNQTFPITATDRYFSMGGDVWTASESTRARQA